MRVWNTTSGRDAVFTLWDNFRLISAVLTNWRMAHLADSLAIQLEAGITTLEALPLAAQVTGDPRAIEAAEQVVASLLKDEKVAESLVVLLEPLTLMVMGLVFGTIIVATMAPIIQLVDGLS